MMDFPEGRMLAEGPLLELQWKQGRVQRLSAAFLRSRCQCASCRNAKIALEPAMFPGLSIESTQLVGSYALQFRFSDGHSHGAFPYSQLESFPDEA